LPQVAAVTLEPGFGQVGMFFRIRRGIRQRQHDLYQGQSIRIAMMDAGNEHAAAAIIFHDMELPQRLGVIQWR
jgi:hypothetical protein